MEGEQAGRGGPGRDGIWQGGNPVQGGDGRSKWRRCCPAREKGRFHAAWTWVRPRWAKCGSQLFPGWRRVVSLRPSYSLPRSYTEFPSHVKVGRRDASATVAWAGGDFRGAVVAFRLQSDCQWSGKPLENRFVPLRFFIHSDSQGAVTLHGEGDEVPTVCRDLAEAIAKARERAAGHEALLVVLDAMGSVVLTETL